MMKRFGWKWQDTVIVVLGIMAISFALYHYHELPDKIPAHFGINGKVDRYDSKDFTLGLLAAMGLILPLLLGVLRKLDPKKANYPAFENAFGMIRLSLAIFLDSILVITVLTGLGQQVSINKIVLTLLGLMFIIMGNYFPQIKSNYFIGIRTPWTMADSEVWRRTHRVSGPVWLASGFVMIAGGFLPNAWGVVVFCAVITVAVAFPIIYSWRISKSN
ncbi:MAG: SdpI family protein [Gorillibacterium sp.]|nr:SdpI family protein [Gorillibacterium sp.]